MTTPTINGQPHEVDAPADMPLLWAIRDLVGFTGIKYGCGRGHCQSGQSMSAAALLQDNPAPDDSAIHAAVGQRIRRLPIANQLRS